ncbi:MAG: adenylate kinase [Egibacteraceae bacterium]
MRRVAVFGLPGTGKTILAIRLAKMLDAPHHDLDRILFTENGPLPLEEFRNQAAQLTSTDSWIVDGNYSKLRDVTWHRADTLVWLDYKLPLIVWRVTCRNLRRLTNREAAPSGFTWQRAFFSRRSVLSNAVRKWLTNRDRYARYAAEASAFGVKVLRFRTPRQAKEWLTELEATLGDSTEAPA